MKLLRPTLALATTLFLFSPTAGQSLDVELQRAIQREVATGDLQKAIDDYKRIADRASSSPAVAASALLHLAQAYEKKGAKDAQGVYQQIVNKYPARTEATTARTRLEALGARPSAITRSSDSPRRICADCVGPMEKSFTLSPDGRFFGYTDLKNDLVIRDLTTLEARRLVSFPEDSYASSRFRARYAIWSPDSRQIAYFFRDVDASGDEKDRAQLRVVANEPGAQPRTLIDNPEFIYVFPTAWSSRGILVTIQRRDLTWEIAWVSPTTKALTRLKSLNWQFDEFGKGPELSRNGQYVVYATFSNYVASASAARGTSLNLNIIAADGSQPETTLPGAASGMPFPVWTPDGAHVVFQEKSGNTNDFDLWEVPIRDGKAAGARSRVMTGLRSGALAGVTNSWVLYRTLRPWVYSQIVFADVRAGETPTALTSLIAYAPAWSPDGRRIAFLSESDGRLTVRSLDTGSQQTYAANDGASLRDLAWFHDGSAILARGSDKGLQVLLRVDMKTLDAQRVVVFDPKEHPQDIRSTLSEPTWTSDGRGIVFGIHEDDGAWTLMRVAAEGGPAQVLGKIDSEEVKRNGSNPADFKVSPDGNRIAWGGYTRTPTTDELWALDLSSLLKKPR